MTSSSANFLPARLHLPTVRLCGALLPLFARLNSDIVGVDIPPDDLARLNALSGQRVLLAPNHPTSDDPVMLFALSRASGIPFHYLSARENFDLYGGLLGPLLQRLGVFSVVRGTSDRESFRFTRQTLAAPASKLVIFPEGEVYSQNDSLLPFHSGVIQMAYWALEDARKAGEADADIRVLPVAVRYRFVQDMTAPIDRTLAHLEDALRLPHDLSDPYARLRRVGVTVLETMEAEYGLKPPPSDGDDLTPRMHATKEFLLDRAAAQIGVTFPASETLPDRVRSLINAVNAVTHEAPTEDRTPYRDRLHRQQADRARPLLHDLNRVANWIAVGDNYVRARPTPERMADNLRRLEVEVFGKARLSGRRRGQIRLGQPISLAAASDAYKADKRGTVARLTDELEVAVQTLLDSQPPSEAAP